jgi:hypothetical protein
MPAGWQTRVHDALRELVAKGKLQQCADSRPDPPVRHRSIE